MAALREQLGASTFEVPDIKPQAAPEENWKLSMPSGGGKSKEKPEEDDIEARQAKMDKDRKVGEYGVWNTQIPETAKPRPGSKKQKLTTGRGSL